MNQPDLYAVQGGTIEGATTHVAPQITEALAAAPAPRDDVQALGDQLANDLAERLAVKGWRLDHVTLAADAITAIALADEGGVARRYEVTFGRAAGDVGKAILAWLQSLEYCAARRPKRRG